VRFFTADQNRIRITNSPLKRHQRPETLKEYSQVIIKLLAFLLRDKGKYKLPLTPKLDQSLHRLQSALETKEIKGIAKAIEDTLFRLWTRTWLGSDDNSVGDPTICWLILATLKPDGTFQGPRDITPVIAKLQYCLRLTFLLAIHSLVKNLECSALEACDRYTKWFTEKHDSTFNSLRSLQHQATSLAMNEVGMPKIIWTDRDTYRSLKYKGHPIEFDKFTNIFETMEDDAIALWEEHVLMGSDLRINYSDIADDLGNETFGYSFLSDHRNACFKERDLLLRHVMSTPALRNRFILGMDEDEKEPIWNHMALRQWLLKYAQFEGILLASVETKAGSPGRGTEICCLEFRNTRTRSQRSLYMIGNHLTVICQYHKSGSITGKDKFIPHAIDAVTSDLIIQDLAIARPFAELATHICYPNDKDVQGRFFSYLFVNNTHLFTTPQLSNILRTYTLPVLDVGLGVSDWRHITAGFRRKICPGLENVIEEDEKDTLQALQSGHSRQVENRIYGLAHDSLAGLGDDILPAYVDVSTDWQVACKIVPGGHMLPYTECQVRHFEGLARAKKIKVNYVKPANSAEDIMERITGIIERKLDEWSSTLLNKLEDKVVNTVHGTMKSALEEITKVNVNPTKGKCDFYRSAKIASDYDSKAVLSKKVSPRPRKPSMGSSDRSKGVYDTPLLPTTDTDSRMLSHLLLMSYLLISNQTISYKNLGRNTRQDIR
jgi:hypothetical protein